MSRRDTIIIALLVNAGLLALLFMLAINTEDDHIIDHPEITKTIVDSRPKVPLQQPTSAIILADTTTNDEVDRFLKDLAAEDISQSILIDEDGYVELERAPQITAKPVARNEPQISDDETYVDITVKRGDALEKLARSNGTTVEAIKKANQLSTAKLSIGQTLRIPISKKSDVSTLKPNPVALSRPVAAIQNSKEPEKKNIPQSEIEYYTVKSGDNPWKIAKQFNVKFEDLLKLNNLDEERARNLKIGDKVRVK